MEISDSVCRQVCIAVLYSHTQCTLLILTTVTRKAKTFSFQKYYTNVPAFYILRNYIYNILNIKQMFQFTRTNYYTNYFQAMLNRAKKSKSAASYQEVDVYGHCAFTVTS